MKKIGITAAVLVIVVVAILVIAYMALVGVAGATPNVGPSKDPTGQKRGPIAYAVYNIQCSVWQSTFALQSTWHGSIKSLDVESYPYINGSVNGPAIGQAVHFDPLGLITSDFEGWITIKVTGPGNYIAQTYTSPKQDCTVTRTDASPRTLTFGPYTSHFWDPGQYSVMVGFYRMNGDTPLQLASQTTVFTIVG